MNIFITGGAGFIGSHVADLLLPKHKVTVYDNLNSAVRTDSPPGLTLVQGDILDGEKLEKVIKDHDLVIAMAAAHLRVSLADPISVHEVNATGTLQTLIAAKKNAIKRFVYISSSESYGSAIGEIMSENHLINPTTVYGVSKYVGELYTKQFGTFEGLKTTIVRPFNTYGPRSHFDGFYGEVIPRMVIKVRNNEAPVIFGDGRQTRDFTYVTDTAKGIIDAAMSDNTIDQTVNIAFGKEVSIGQIALKICQTINPKLTPLHEPARPNDVMRHAADTKKAQKLINWNPLISINEGLEKYIEWQLQNYPDVKAIRSQVPETNW